MAHSGDARSHAVPAIHKDFYLRHPAASLQTEEFYYGDLQAAHPEIGRRSEEDSVRWRIEHGTTAEVLRGRGVPRPMKKFSETAFPEFVEHVAMELFTSAAVPRAIQAQGWPCVQAGMDVIAVAPTGSGKTLMFILPSLVHVIAQPPLMSGEGPIALVLVPTQDLAEQVHEVAELYYQRTTGDQRVHAGKATGGVAYTSQCPARGEPWPELLVATPGRFLDLVQRGWLDAGRVSYVVLDEADLLVSYGWLPKIQIILSHVHPQRQLILCSATWRREAELVAAKLFRGDDLVQLRVDPAVPPIPQDVRLFVGERDDVNQQQEAALIKWINEERGHDEAVLVFCGPKTVQQLGQFLKGNVPQCKVDVLSVEHSERSERSASLSLFMDGRLDILVAPFILGGRGLDYSRPGVCLRLAVIIFDFPPSVVDYVHAIGRTMRPGQHGGRVVTFLPEFRFWAVPELIGILENSQQDVPLSLRKQNEEDVAFLESCRSALNHLEAGALHQDGVPFGSVDGDLWTLPSNLPSYRRRLLHVLSGVLGLPHVSTGTVPNRTIHFARDRAHLPAKYFEFGEKVAVKFGNKSKGSFGTIMNHKIHPLRRTVKVLLDNGYPDEFPIDDVSLCTDSQD